MKQTERAERVQLLSKFERGELSIKQMRGAFLCGPILYSTDGRKCYSSIDIDEVLVSLRDHRELQRYQVYDPSVNASHFLKSKNKSPLEIFLGYVPSSDALIFESIENYSFILVLPSVKADLDDLKRYGFKIIQKPSDLARLGALDQLGTRPSSGWSPEQVETRNQRIELEITNKRKSLKTVFKR